MSAEEQSPDAPRSRYQRRRGVPTKLCVCYPVSAGILAACPHLSPGPCSLLPSLSFPLNPRGPEERVGGWGWCERTGWVSATLTTPPRRAHAHTCSAGTGLVFVPDRHAALCLASVPMRADILSYVHILCTLRLSVSLSSFHTWQAAASHWQRSLLLFS